MKRKAELIDKIKHSRYIGINTDKLEEIMKDIESVEEGFEGIVEENTKLAEIVEDDSEIESVDDEN